MHYNVKQHIGRWFIGSCRASLASNEAPWSNTKKRSDKNKS